MRFVVLPAQAALAIAHLVAEEEVRIRVRVLGGSCEDAEGILDVARRQAVASPLPYDSVVVQRLRAWMWQWTLR